MNIDSKFLRPKVANASVRIKLNPNLPPAPKDVKISVQEAIREQICRSCGQKIDHLNHQPRVIITYPQWVVFRKPNGTKVINHPLIFMHCRCFKLKPVRYVDVDKFDEKSTKENPIANPNAFKLVEYCQQYPLTKPVEEVEGLKTRPILFHFFNYTLGESLDHTSTFIENYPVYKRISEAARILNRDAQTIRKWVKQGNIAFQVIGKNREHLIDINSAKSYRNKMDRKRHVFGQLHNTGNEQIPQPSESDTNIE
jgi:hypothetical protein